MAPERNQEMAMIPPGQQAGGHRQQEEFAISDFDL
jgi:hypothetical protein